jgi:lactate dehydrogenase-like 2-hydroxyacid dehydrogenase
MKPTARLINASRGPIVEEQALISVLKNKQIAGAANRRIRHRAAASVSPLPDAGQPTGNAVYRLRIARSLQDVLREYRLEYPEVVRHGPPVNWIAADIVRIEDGI